MCSELLQSTHPKNQLLSRSLPLMGHSLWSACLAWCKFTLNSLLPDEQRNVCFLSVFLAGSFRYLTKSIKKPVFPNEDFSLCAGSRCFSFYNTPPMLSYRGGDEPPNRLTHGFCPRFRSGFYGNRHQMAQNTVRARRHLMIPRRLQTLFVQHLFPWKQMQKWSASALQ